VIAGSFDSGGRPRWVSTLPEESFHTSAGVPDMPKRPISVMFSSSSMASASGTLAAALIPPS